MTALLSILAQKISLRYGRTEVIIVSQLIATGCLFCISFYPPFWAIAMYFKLWGTAHINLFFFLKKIRLYIFRGSFMRCSGPLCRSILMDFVPKNRRGLCNSIEGIAWGFFWNISAVLGGYLIETYDYSMCFFITSGLYLLGTLPFFFLLPVIKNERGKIQEEKEKNNEEDDSPEIPLEAKPDPTE